MFKRTSQERPKVFTSRETVLLRRKYGNRWYHKKSTEQTMYRNDIEKKGRFNRSRRTQKMTERDLRWSKRMVSKYNKVSATSGQV